jgi:large subunit ribosomal protein L29
MKIQEMRQMTLDDLRVKLKELSQESFNLKFRLATQPLDDPLTIRRIRRDIARVKTLIREKTKAQAAATGADGTS